MSKDDHVNGIDLKDPIRITLRSIVEITYILVKALKAAGKVSEANQIIVWVAECLHGILVKKLMFYQLKPFTPEVVRNRYNAQRAKAFAKYCSRNRCQSK